MKKIIRHTLPDKCRIIAVSDVHTCFRLLDKVLKKAAYRPNEDYLVIVGDILEHGNFNLETIDFVRDLCDNDRVYFLMGNNDTASYHMAYKYNYERFMQRRSKKPNSAFLQMAAKIGITEFPEDRFEKLRAEVNAAFDTELRFIQSRPYLLETQHHIFVHAGIENRPDWENTSDTYALTRPFYLNEEQCSGKWVVVGHFPCYNYEASDCTNLPIIDRKKKIICIDGGLTIKSACQLNAFVIEKNADSYAYDTVWDTDFDRRVILSDHITDMNDVYVDPYKNRLTVISRDGELCRVKDEVSGRSGLLLCGELYEENDRIFAWNRLSAFPNVRKGDIVHHCRTLGSYANIITENGKVGWIPSMLLGDKI